MIKHLLMLSGGICSWAATKRVIAAQGVENVTLLFADTIIEDDDLYRFLIEIVSRFHGRPITHHCFSLPPLSQMDERKAAITRLRRDTMAQFPLLKWIADGRTPWEVMRDHRMIFKPRVDACSRELKRDLLDKWRNENCDVTKTVVYLGIDWTESHRLERVQKLCAPWRYEAPMCEPPYLQKPQMIEWLKREGIAPPRLYAMGFPHNNCGGFCIKAGQSHFAHLLRTMPERYAYHEGKEEEMRELVGDYSVLRDRTGGTTKTLTLKTLRERIEANQTVDLFDWGGCGCAVDVETETEPTTT